MLDSSSSEDHSRLHARTRTTPLRLVDRGDSSDGVLQTGLLYSGFKTIPLYDPPVSMFTDDF